MMTMRFSRFSSRNWTTFRGQPLTEISGALGDLGTFLPILIALAVNDSISLPATLVFSGLYNIFTGWFFGIPLPVQPMKAIAAVAIARDFDGDQIAAAGIFAGVVIFVFTATGALRWFANAVPIPVVKGIQVGAGLSLVISAGAKLKGKMGWIEPRWADNYLWVIAALVGLLVTNIYRRVPYGLILFLLGLVFAFVSLATSGHGDLPHFSIWIPRAVQPTTDDWKVGIIQAGIGQIPLTTLNSIIAVVHLAGDLLPDVRTPSITSIGFSVAMMNLVGTCVGCMPVCHGSGGLAAQYRFGARSGASIIFLGAVKLIVGIFLGNTLLDLLYSFPTAFLAVMVIAAGLELASVGESLNTTRAWDLGNNDRSSSLPTLGLAEVKLTDEERKRRWTVMIVTVGLLVAFKNAGIGFVAGMLCHWTFGLPSLIERIRSRWSEGRIRLASGRGQD
uniref:Sulfate transporter n=1 Tax=Coccidioides posadasii RMSCC 3488 TaxID=454284 RepID=A0A0J6FD49_COCPO|nr:sulfate transporter [Coccidioides posadasii RMSCC 3488]